MNRSTVYGFQIAVREGEWKLYEITNEQQLRYVSEVEHASPAHGTELYNLKEDPDEFHNLVNDPKYKDVLYELKDRMLRFTIEYETNYPLIDKLGC